MNSRIALMLLFILATPTVAQAVIAPPGAADSGATADTVFERAQRLAANGQGDAARALVQQQFEAAPTGSPRYVEALYWRAVVAATAADAERDLRTLIVDYPLSAWSVEALMRLAQLEMTRGDMDKALAHLDRVLTEHPTNSAGARANFWMARVMLEQGRLPDACRHLADAGRTVVASDVELHNQIDYWMTRCRTADTTSVVASQAGADSAKPAPGMTGRGAGVSSAVPAAAPRAAPAAKRQYCVQVAAYDSRAAADKLAETLRGRGYDSRVYGAMAPYRVRIGRYATRAQADSAAQKLNAKRITGFVTEAESR
jgi:cell division septation protein DedD